MWRFFPEASNFRCFRAKNTDNRINEVTSIDVFGSQDVTRTRQRNVPELRSCFSCVVSPLVPSDLIGIIFGLHRTSERLPFLGKTVVKGAGTDGLWLLSGIEIKVQYYLICLLPVIFALNNFMILSIMQTPLIGLSSLLPSRFVQTANSWVQLRVVVSPCMPRNGKSMGHVLHWCATIGQGLKSKSQAIEVATRINNPDVQLPNGKTIHQNLQAPSCWVCHCFCCLWYGNIGGSVFFKTCLSAAR